MVRVKLLFVIIYWLGLANFARAQESATQETSPASMKWYRINTEHFKVLYPEGYSSEAQRVANTLEHIRQPEAATLGPTPKKISIVLHSQSATSNGFVTVAPWRSEFYAMPPQNYNFLGTNEWLSLLASHEYRHMVQFRKSYTGVSKALYYLFGQTGQAAAAFAAAPQWFWEGDAVATETAFTPSGRGRIPEFDLLFRTNLLEGRNFNYHKQYLRSYKHNVPDHYVLGYHMVSYLRKKTGNANIWGDISQRAWNFPFVPFTFSNAIKKETGMYVTQLYREMAADVKKEWLDEQQGLKITDFETITKRKSKSYTDYAYPQPLADGRIVVLKSGIGDISQFTILSPSGEEKEHVPGPLNDAGMLSVSANKLVWNEYRFDPRWLTRSYSVIKSYSWNEGKVRTVTTQSRYSAAALSSEGARVATVETDITGKINLVVIDAISGDVLKKFDNTGNEMISMPRWSDDASIVFLKSSSGGKRVVRLNYETGVEETIYNSGQENVGHPVVYKNYLFYNSPYSGIDNIYCQEITTGKRFQVTCSKYGAYNPAMSVDGNYLYYNDQSKDGLNVVRIPFRPEMWMPIENVKINKSLFGDVLAEQEGNQNIMRDVPQTQYPSKRFHRASGMINPHSWGVDFQNTLAQANIGIVSRDILTTTLIRGGYLYDINEKTGAWQAAVSYQGMYPIIDASFDYAKREDKTSVFGRDVTFNWTEIGGSAGVRIPLLLTRSKYNTSVSVGNSVGLTQVSGFKNLVEDDGAIVSSGFGRLVPANDTLSFNFTDRASNGTLISNHFNITASNLLKRSRRDFNPRWGQAAVVETFSTLPAGDFNGRMNVARATLYFPGLLKHHSLYFRGGYQESLSDPSLTTYQFRNRLPKPRGYSYPRDTKFISVSANYALPIWYPDISIGPVVNLQRIKTNLFFDYGKSEGFVYLYRFQPNQATQRYFINNAATYQSMGGELTFDMNVMRFLPQVELGVRATYITANKFFNNDVVIEFIIGNIPF